MLVTNAMPGGGGEPERAGRQTSTAACVLLRLRSQVTSTAAHAVGVSRHMEIYFNKIQGRFVFIAIAFNFQVPIAQLTAHRAIHVGHLRTGDGLQA